MKLQSVCWDLYEKSRREATIKVAIDAGANEGGYTHDLLEFGFFVHAFEPVPNMYEILESRFRNDRRVACNRFGLSDRHEVVSGVTVLSCWTLAPPGTGGLETALDYKTAPVFDMNVTTLDAYMAGRPVGIIKLDVDGYEHKFIKGAAETIKRWRPPILCELSCYIHKTGQSPEEFVNNVASLGYSFVSMDGSVKMKTWVDIEPQWPYHSSYDVMLMPDEI